MAAPDAQPNLPLLHRFLGIGLVLLSIAAVIGKAFGVVPLLSGDDLPGGLMAYVFTGIAAVAIAVAVLVFKPQVPPRQPGQSVDVYWARPEVASKALQVWFLMEGGAIMAIIGFGMTAEPLAAAAMALSVTAYWLGGPNVFAKG